MDNSALIDRFSMVTYSRNLPKISFRSDEKTARAVKEAMIETSDFWDDIQFSFHNYPEVQVLIYTKGKPDIEKFLTINSVRKAFEASESGKEVSNG